jgi:hypothetical protein
MKNKYWITSILLIGSMRLFGQDSSKDSKLAIKVASLKLTPSNSAQNEGIQNIRVTNSFIILVDNKLATSVAS